jgi:hypothetical protein
MELHLPKDKECGRGEDICFCVKNDLIIISFGKGV